MMEKLRSRLRISTIDLPTFVPGTVNAACWRLWACRCRKPMMHSSARLAFANSYGSASADCVCQRRCATRGVGHQLDSEARYWLRRRCKRSGRDILAHGDPNRTSARSWFRRAAPLRTETGRFADATKIPRAPVRLTTLNALLIQANMRAKKTPAEPSCHLQNENGGCHLARLPGWQPHWRP